MSDLPEKLDGTTKNAATKNDTEAQKRPVVLLVEDAIELAEILRVTLEQLDLQVFHEAHGRKATERYFEVNPALVLLDIALPDLTGWKVLETIRENRRGGTAPKILVITAYSDPANRLMGKLQDVDGYLVKPFKPGELETEVRKVLGLPKTK